MISYHDIIGYIHTETSIYTSESKVFSVYFYKSLKPSYLNYRYNNKMSMLRKLTSCYIRRLAMVPNSKSVQPIQQARFMSSKSEETDAEFDARYEAYFNRPDIDGWEVS